MTSTATKWCRTQRLKIRKARHQQCEVKGCTTKTNLEMAHIRSTGLSGEGRGSHTRIKDWKTHPKSYKLVCDKHGRALDRGEKFKFVKT